jgi:hypothetical protein
MSGISASGRFCDGLIALTLTLVHDDRGVHLLVSLAESCRGSNRSNNVDCTRKIPYNALREPGKNSNVEKAYRVKRVQDCTNLLHYQSGFLSPLWYNITQRQKMPQARSLVYRAKPTREPSIKNTNAPNASRTHRNIPITSITTYAPAPPDAYSTNIAVPASHRLHTPLSAHRHQIPYFPSHTHSLVLGSLYSNSDSHPSCPSSSHGRHPHRLAFGCSRAHTQSRDAGCRIAARW